MTTAQAAQETGLMYEAIPLGSTLCIRLNLLYHIPGQGMLPGNSQLEILNYTPVRGVAGEFHGV